MTEKVAKEFLASLGYAVNNLWQISDVTSQLQVSDEEALEIMNTVLDSEYICGKINEDILDYGRENGIKEVEE